MQQGAVSAERIHLRNEEKRKRVQALLWVISTKLDVQALFKCCGEVMPANHTRPSNCGRGVIALERARGIISTLISDLPMQSLGYSGVNSTAEIE